MKEEESLENTEEGLSDRFFEAYIRCRCCTLLSLNQYDVPSNGVISSLGLISSLHCQNV
jgi:hypothetical protein